VEATTTERPKCQEQRRAGPEDDGAEQELSRHHPRGQTVKRTAAETKQIGTNIVNTIVADMMSYFPRIRAAIDKIPREAWVAFVENTCDATGENLISAFGASDS
jgi:hypothetical protein